MKKYLLATICLIIAMVFAGCTAPASKIANEYKFGYASEQNDGLLERFVYDITAENDETANPKPPFLLEGSGTYTTQLFKEAEEYKFRLETQLQFNGRYYFTEQDGYSEYFDDTITTVSYGYIYSEKFTPINASKTYKTSIPVNENDVYMTKKAYYTVTATYDGNKISSHLKDDENYPDSYKMESETNKNFTAEIKDRFIENEFIFLAIRLQTLSTRFSDGFKVPYFQKGIVQTLSFAASQNLVTKTFKNLDNSAEEKDYECIVISSSLSGNYGGKVTMYFTNDYLQKYKCNNNEVSQNLSLMLEFKQENLLYTLKEYNNYAEKP